MLREGPLTAPNQQDVGVRPATPGCPVKPSAQPTLVRIQHPPPPAQTARDLWLSRSRAVWSVGLGCPTFCRGLPLAVTFHGRGRTPVRRLSGRYGPAAGRRQGDWRARAGIGGRGGATGRRSAVDRPAQADPTGGRRGGRRDCPTDGATGPDAPSFLGGEDKSWCQLGRPVCWWRVTSQRRGAHERAGAAGQHAEPGPRVHRACLEAGAAGRGGSSMSCCGSWHGRANCHIADIRTRVL